MDKNSIAMHYLNTASLPNPWSKGKEMVYKFENITGIYESMNEVNG